MAIQTSQILPKEDSETLTKSVYDQYDKLHSVIYYDKESKVEKIVKVKVDPIGRVKESKTLKQIKVDVLKPATPGLNRITFQGSILDAGTLPVTRVGFTYWRDVNDPGFAIGGDDAGTDTSLDSGKFEQTVTGLEKDTTYYYRAYATNEYGTNYSRIYSVTTLTDPNLVIAGVTTGTAPFTISLTAVDDEQTPQSYAWNLTGGNSPQFTTQVVNYTYTTAGTYTVNLTGFYGGGETAIRTLTAQANADDTSVVAQWASVQNSAYYGNVIGAYDMRNREGSTINAIVGPNLESVNTTLSASVGTVFNGDGSYLFSNATIPVTFPHTLVFVGRVNVSGANNETVLIAAQRLQWQQTSNENAMIFGRPSQLNAYNGNDNQNMGYVPNGSEWFYVAASFLANNTVRYQIRSRTQNLNGTLAGNASKLNFNGFVGFGAGLNSATQYGYVGTVRLGMFINQEFTTEGAMTTLFESVTAGPANGLLV